MVSVLVLYYHTDVSCPDVNEYNVRLNKSHTNFGNSYSHITVWQLAILKPTFFNYRTQH